jgi:HSP20 family protein
MLPMLRNRLIPAPSDQALLGQWNDMRREIDRLFDSALGGTFVGSSWWPAMDLEESQNIVRLTFEVPGVSPEHLSVTVENGVLTVSGEKRSERQIEGEAGGPGAFERQYGRFERSIVLPQSVDVDNVSAHSENGVLTIELQKRAEAQPRRIEIGLGGEKKQLRSGTGGQRGAA